MVALHNHKLSQRDIFRGNLWEWDQLNAKKQELIDARLAAGERQLEAMMNGAEDFRKYLAAQASMREMQAVMKRIYPTKVVISTSDVFRKALEEIRDGHNDPRSLAAEVLSLNS